MKQKKVAIGLLDVGAPRVFINGELEFEQGLRNLSQQDVCTRLILQYKGEEVLDRVALDPRQSARNLTTLEDEWENLCWIMGGKGSQYKEEE